MQPATQMRIDSENQGSTGGAVTIGSLSLLVALVMFIALPGNVLAGRKYEAQHWQGRVDRFVLDYNDSRVSAHRGKPAVLYLKKELLRQYPGVDVTSLRLRKVVLVAKTKAGFGTARLRVGPEMSNIYQVAGSPPDFRSSNAYSFDRTPILNPFNPSWGPWQLHLKGHFKLRKVVLEVEERSRRQYGWDSPGGGFHWRMR